MWDMESKKALVAEDNTVHYDAAGLPRRGVGVRLLSSERTLHDISEK